MPRVSVPQITITKAGIDPAGDEVNGDPTNNHVVPGIDSKTMLFVRNAHESNPLDLTFITPGDVEGQAISDRVVEIPAASSRWFSGFSGSLYGAALQVNVEAADLKLSAYRTP